MPLGFQLTLWASAVGAAAVGWGVKVLLPPLHPVFAAAAILGPYVLTYAVLTLALQVPEAQATLRRILRRAS